MSKVSISFKRCIWNFLQRAPLDVIIDNEVKLQVDDKAPVTIELSPGVHYLKMSYKYAWMRGGQVATQIFVEENKILLVDYHAPLLVLENGTVLINSIYDY